MAVADEKALITGIEINSKMKPGKFKNMLYLIF